MLQKPSVAVLRVGYRFNLLCSPTDTERGDLADRDIRMLNHLEY